MDGRFEPVLINVREKPLSQDINRAQSVLMRTLLGLVDQFTAKRTSNTDDTALRRSGFIGNSFRVLARATPGMGVRVVPGIGFFDNNATKVTTIGGLVGVDDADELSPLVLSQEQDLPLDAAPSVGNSRIDIIETRIRRELVDPTTRKILNEVTGSFDPNLVMKTLSHDAYGDIGQVNYNQDSAAAISVKKGQAATTGTETEPGVTPGYVKIGRVNIAAGDVTIADDTVIVDPRRLLFPGGVGHAFCYATAPGAADLYATLNKVVAPPGVAIGSGKSSSSGGTALRVALFMKAGLLSGGVASAISQINTATYDPFFYDASVETIVAGGLRTALIAGGLKVAVGQQVLRMVDVDALQTAYTIQSHAMLMP